MYQHIITYCPTYLLLKSYINAGKVLKTFWELISYHVYSNKSGRNYCFSYNTGRKMEALHVSSFFKVSTDHKWLEPSGLNPGSPTPGLGTCPGTWTSRGSFQLLQPDSSPAAVLPLSCYCLGLPACSSSSWVVSSHCCNQGRKCYFLRPKPTLPFHSEITLPDFRNTQL